MSYSISTLLTRNLQDVFGENDPVRRRAAIDEIWTEDGVFYDPKTGVHRGRDGYRAGLVRRQLTPELISSLPGRAGLPPFISFLTSYLCRGNTEALPGSSPVGSEVFVIHLIPNEFRQQKRIRYPMICSMRLGSTKFFATGK